MADNERATPKKKNRFPRKKKNDASKNNGAKTPTKNAVESGAGKGGGVTKGRVEMKPTANSNSREGIVYVPPEQRNARWEEPNTKKRTVNSPSAKNANSSKIERNGPSQPPVPRSEGGRKMEHPDGYRNRYMERMEIQNQTLQMERNVKWNEYFLSNHNDLLRMDRNQVIMLKKVEKNRPQAQFKCKICNYYCDNLTVVGSHIHKSTHIRQLKDFKDEVTIKEMPEMTKDQMNHLNEFLKKQVELYSMDPIHLETRRTIGVLVSELVSANLPGCSTRLFGSSIHGLGLKTSDVNIDLQVPEGVLPPEMLKEVAALLRKSTHFMDVVENFHCEFPFIGFKYLSGANCSISLNNERAVSLALLLSKYTPLDPRLTQLAMLFRLWGQITETDKAQDGTLPGYAFYLLTIFYLQKCDNPVLPVLNDLLPNKGESVEKNTAKVLSLDIGDIKSKWLTRNKQTLAELWLGLLRFYAVEFNYTEFQVSIDSSALQPRNTRKLFIVDPFLPTRNVARSVNANPSFFYIMGCLMTSCRYFSMPQTTFGPLFANIYVPAAAYPREQMALLQTHERINSLLIHLIMELDSAFQQPRGDVQQHISDVTRMIHKHRYMNEDNIPVSYIEQNCVPPRHMYGNMSVSPQDAHQLVSSFSAKLMEYSLARRLLTGGEEVPRICGVCKCEGHLKEECPEEKLPPLDPIPERLPGELKIVDQLCLDIFERLKQSDEDLQKREKICQELQEFIGAEYPTAKLELFGSTKNGFGLKGSDMDICLSFEDNKTGEGLDTRGFIEILYQILKQSKDLQDLLPIATAKVPIVKFTHKSTKLDGDISLYNVLALENSKLLCTYAQIDERARVLGYMIKRFSKICHIGDASKGSLSSYAYTLLVIYFLQRCDPPVLPVLQELTENAEPPPKHIVEGCNAYFFSDLTKLDSVWKGRNKNLQSVGELWLDLLVFYTEKFDMLNNVICIRCSRTVTKFEKLWISKGIAIEDPFDLSHNLGSALTRKMSLYIIKALRKGRNHFARPVKIQMRDSKTIEAYFMNVRELTDGEPPNDRGCRVCKSIGHKERECPQKRKKKGKKGAKSLNKPRNDESPSKKAPISEDEDFSDSDNESSDQEDNTSQRETPKKVVNQPQFKQNRDNNGNSNRAKQSKPPPNNKARPNSGFKQKPEPASKIQDQNGSSGSQSSFSTHPKTPISIPRTPNPQVAPMNSNGSASPNTSNSDLANTVKQNSVNTAHIPTRIFSNSSLNPDLIPATVNSVSFPIPRFQILPETVRGGIPPPPGFNPLVQPQPFSGLPFRIAAPNQQSPWVADSIPRPYVQMVRPRPPMGLPQVPGMLGPTEQRIWGHSTSDPPTFAPMPRQPFAPRYFDRESADMKHTLGLEAELSDLQINAKVCAGYPHNL